MSSSLEYKEDEIIKSIISIVREHLNPKRIILFGSRVTGKAKKFSDFDIAVEGVVMDIRKERLLKDALDKCLGIYTVDLINLDKVDSEFRKFILDEGKLIYERCK